VEDGVGAGWTRLDRHEQGLAGQRRME
jgi:hypothetical protein